MPLVVELAMLSECQHYSFLADAYPNRVYSTTPIGKRKVPAAVGMPVSDVTVAEPPVRSMAGDQYVCHQGKDDVDNMGDDAISSADDFQKGMRVWRSSLKLDG